MRIIVTAAILTLAAATALPASACDRHGSFFGQLGGASWTDYDPATADADALFLEQQLSEWHRQNAVPPAEVKPKKPTFSSASNRAAKAAQARMARKAKLTQAAKPEGASNAKFESTDRPTLTASER